MNRLVGIVNLEAGNAASIERALDASEIRSVQVKDEEMLKRCSHIILPGVASFGAVIEELRSKNLFEPLRSLYESDIKLLGLCAGMQIMGKASQENPGVKGLGWFTYENVQLVNNEERRSFHTGWNSIRVKENQKLLSVSNESSFYFNHSYYVPNVEEEPESFGSTDFLESTMVSIFKHNNVMGMQFHPEKSQVEGLNILKHFAEWE